MLRLSIREDVSKWISTAAFYAFKHPKLLVQRGGTIHLDIGSGPTTPRNPLNCSEAWGLDHVRPKVDVDWNFVRADLTKPLPFESNFFDSISAWDVLEHVSRGDGSANPFLNLMSEIHRVLKPGGYFLAVTPAYPHPFAFQDPTHVNYLTIGTAPYFATGGVASTYGYWDCQGYEILVNDWHVVSLTTKPKQSHLQKLGKWFSALVLLALQRLRLIRPSHLLWVMRKPRSNGN